MVSINCGMAKENGKIKQMMSHVGNGYLEYTYLKYINLETKYQNHSYKSVTIDMHVVTT